MISSYYQFKNRREENELCIHIVFLNLSTLWVKISKIFQNFISRDQDLSLFCRIYCDRNYLIPSCEEYCVFKNDTSGHYRCDYVHGRKVCLEGWYENDCLKKKRHCKPRDDELGHYKCHPITGEIVCLDGWRNETSKCTKGIFEVFFQDLSK